MRTITKQADDRRLPLDTGGAKSDTLRTPLHMLKKSKRICYGLLPSELADPSATKVTPIIITEGETGYHPTDWSWDKKVAEQARDAKNALLGISPEEAERLMVASMFPKSSHTPGPWKCKPLITPNEDDDPMGTYVVEPAHTKLAKAYFEAAPESPELDAVHSENEANARLIEAAPELLEALKAVLFDLEATHKWQVENGRIDPVLVPQRESDIAKARAVIAKAKRK